MADNFYIVLGVSRDAEPAQIRSAYRRLVRQYHPDVSREGPDRFLAVQRAYETLSDPNARESYDHQIQAGSRREPAEVVETYPISRYPRSAEPFSRDALGAGLFDSLFGDVDEFFGGFIPGFFETSRMRSKRKDLYVELILTPDEAASGGIYSLQVPVHSACPECGGTGYVGRLHCSACLGEEVDYQEFNVAVPRGVVDGQRTKLSLEDVGLPDVALNVLVSVRP